MKHKETKDGTYISIGGGSSSIMGVGCGDALVPSIGGGSSNYNELDEGHRDSSTEEV